MKYKWNYRLEVELYRAGLKADKISDILPTLLTLRRLAKKHHKLAEIACNGEGYIRGQFYSGDSNTGNTAMVTNGVYVWDIESGKVEAKIKALTDKIGLRVEFQGDPRGYTCKFYFGERFLDLQA